ncbi:MAG: class I SAM-dependent methyltransferase [Hellea sp.]
MIEGKPSQTAFLTAVQRGHHFHTAPEPKVLRDNLALDLAGLENLQAAQVYIDKMIQVFSALSDDETASIFMGRIDGSVCMRSRVVEEELAIARERGLKQLVILGAGLDSTAYRCLDLTKVLDVFEVDHPSTQAWKKEQVKAAGITVPDNLSYVSFDFENQTLGEALKLGGVKTDSMTFFTWLGVHMYLTDAAVKSTLNVLGAYPKGSEIVMDFISPSYVLAGGVPENSVEQLQKVVTEMGEPIKSRYYEAELEEILKTAGFSEVKYLSAKWLVDNYLGGDKAAFDMPDEATSILTAVI